MLEQRLDALITPALERITPAVCLGVYHRDDTVFTKAWGTIDPDTRELPVTLSTWFDLASLTKIFTTTALLSLISRHDIGLHRPLVEFIPEFGAISPRPIEGGQDPHTKQPLPVTDGLEGQTVDPAGVTLWHLLTHTSGLPPWRDVYTVAPAPVEPPQVDPITPDERWRRAVERLCSYGFVAPIGEAVAYSDVGLMLLAEVVARLNGTDLATAITQLVLQPLNFKQTLFNPVRDHALDRQTIAPTEIDATWRKRRVWGEVHDENACGVGGVAGHAGLFAAVNDVLHLGITWLNQTTLPISDALWQAARTEQAVTGMERRGLGWMLRSAQSSIAGDLMSMDTFGHTGFTGTSLLIDPVHEVVVALLTNRVYAGRDVIGHRELRRQVHDCIMETLA